MKPFLILQLRPETDASDDEFQAFLSKGNLSRDEVHRIRLDQDNLPADLNLDAYSGVIVGGGPGCVSDAPEKKKPIEAKIEAECLSLMPEITARDMPFLGCCYGIGILGHHLEPGAISKDRYGEPVRATPCRVTDDGKTDPLLNDLPEEFEAFVGHKEAMQHLPAGCTHLVSAPDCPFQMVRFGQNVYATQFHPEADAHGFETRIGIYKHHGYFPPEEAQSLIEMVHAANVVVPEQILANFVSRYRNR
ncbi:glutamine amidotransferase [Aliiroseovarius crassostreae]|uniref:Glutamine amidotransferase n=1 Tax=Aliiroseovarius crassostreae TaxID=154981 RepID=A0A9Q9HBZ9_9RHOB|nr:glutamine amidotransferase [Aliiroseovarius crassostreae]UWP96486.1 glutamine amidotransferase [Aliiroseovarius crassostreae]UWP99634.1 glutamine amidotransferase [Aliiroseovarius crassostreae]